MPSQQPIGVILAGGHGVRMGGAKLTVALRGQPLIRYPLEVMRSVLGEVAVISKADILLPRMGATTVWIEPDMLNHPLFGVVEALGLAAGRPVLVCPADFPFVTPDLLAALAAQSPEGRPAVVAAAGGVPCPLLGCYQPAAAPLLSQAAHRGVSPEQTLAVLKPVLVEVGDETELFDIDTPDDLLQAAAMLDRIRPVVKG